MAYSTTTDLLTGNIPLPSYLSADKFVNDAADEIDSQLGFIYETPIDTTAAERPVALLLKRINNFLATGRLLMAVDAGGEDNSVHAYGVSLVNEAKAAIKAIVDGVINLPGVPILPGETAASKIQFSNKDPESNVEAFYDRIIDPSYIFPDQMLPTPGRLVSGS